MASDGYEDVSDQEADVGFTIEIDTGGTFTDGYVSGGDNVVTAKSDTTPYDLSTGVLACVDRAAEQLSMSRTELLRATDAFRLSTTVGTNTLINRNGPTVGLLLDEDVSPILDELSPNLPLDLDLVETLNPEAEPAAVQSAVRRLLEHGARVLVIALQGGERLAERETAVRNLIAEFNPRHYLGAVPVLPSHQVTPLDDERVRVQTSVLSAYLHPVMSSFLYRVEDALRAGGYSKPLLVADASGGTSRVAKTSALRTWGSGPAGGVAATATLAKELRSPVAVGFDVGGTSTDICVIVNGQWHYEVQPTIEDVDVALPVLALVSAPIGGGTIARATNGVLTLGPDSAGAQPGPACFGLGGEFVTVTDAVCYLGLFDPDNFLGGRKTLDTDAAAKVLNDLAKDIGTTPDDLATQILIDAGKTIANAISRQLEAAGVSGPVSLFATGGAGGMLAGYVHEAAQPTETFAFPISAVFSAFGLSQLDVKHAYELSPNSTSLDADIDALRTRALADMRSEGFAADEVRFTIESEAIDSTTGKTIVVDGLVADEGDGMIPRLVRLTASTRNRRARLPQAGTAPADPSGTRAVQTRNGLQKTPVFDWASLSAGARIDGPAILETDETTLAVPADHEVHIGTMGEAKLVKTL